MTYKAMPDKATAVGSSRLHPRVFIGSSVESHYLARGLQQALTAEGCHDVTVWSDRPPQHHQPVVEWLDEIRSDFDLAAFIAAPDDTVISRGHMSATARDNVIFELGFFHGVLGRAGCYLVGEARSPVKQLSDLLGTLPLSFAMQDVLRPGGGAAEAMRSAASTLMQEWERRSGETGVLASGRWFQLTYTSSDGSDASCQLNSIDLSHCWAVGNSIRGTIFRLAKHAGGWVVHDPDEPAFEFEGIWQFSSLSCTYRPIREQSGRSTGVVHMTKVAGQPVLEGMYVRERNDDDDPAPVLPTVTRRIVWLRERSVGGHVAHARMERVMANVRDRESLVGLVVSALDAARSHKSMHTDMLEELSNSL